MEALVLQELDLSSGITCYFWHNNYQSVTRSMNERENSIRSIGIPCIACGCVQFMSRFLARSLAYKLGISCVVIRKG